MGFFVSGAVLGRAWELCSFSGLFASLRCVFARCLSCVSFVLKCWGVPLPPWLSVPRALVICFPVCAAPGGRMSEVSLLVSKLSCQFPLRAEGNSFRSLLRHKGQRKGYWLFTRVRHRGPVFTRLVAGVSYPLVNQLTWSTLFIQFISPPLCKPLGLPSSFGQAGGSIILAPLTGRSLGNQRCGW